MKWLRDKRGDTLMEVLIATAVVGLILVMSYSLANRSTQAVRQAQERSEALKIAESQVEYLATFLNSGQAAPSGNFCLTNPTTAVGGTCSQGTDGRYRLTISRQPANPNIYNVNATWVKVNGQGNDQLTLHHKIYRAQQSDPVDYAYQYACANGIDDDEDGKVDYVAPAGQVADSGGCSSATDDDEVDPPLSSLTVEVKKILPGAGNSAPDCSTSPSSSNGIDVRVTGGGEPQRGPKPSTAIFNDLNAGKNYTASVTAPTGYSHCGSSSQGFTTTPNSATPLTFKLRCNVSKYNSGWAVGARRADLDGHYIHNHNYSNSTYGYNWNSRFVAGHHTASGTFFYYYSYDTSWNSEAAYYNLYEAKWYSDPVYNCP